LLRPCHGMPLDGSSQKASSVEIVGEIACATEPDQQLTKQGGAGIQPAEFLPRTGC
jgi:hypothetical protein